MLEATDFCQCSSWHQDQCLLLLLMENTLDGDVQSLVGTISFPCTFCTVGVCFVFSFLVFLLGWFHANSLLFQINEIYIDLDIMMNIELHIKLYMTFIFSHKFGEVLLWHNRTTQQSSQDTLQEGNLLYLPFKSYLEHLLVHLWFLLALHSLPSIFHLLAEWQHQILFCSF